MNYIISKYPLEYLVKKDRPIVEPPVRIGWGRPKVSNIRPRVKRFKAMIEDIAMDLQWISICYNDPIYVYVFIGYKILPIPWVKDSNTISITGFGKCSDMQCVENPEEYKLPMQDRFYQDDFEKFEKEVKSMLESICALDKRQIFNFKLTKENGFKRIL